MSSFTFKDANGAIQYAGSNGAGTTANPFVPQFQPLNFQAPQPVTFPSPQQVLAYNSITGFYNRIYLQNDIVKPAAGTVWALTLLQNDAASTRYFWLFDSATVPGTGLAYNAASVKMIIAIPANGSEKISNSELGAGYLNFTSGISWAFSTSRTAYTLSSSVNEACITLMYS